MFERWIARLRANWNESLKKMASAEEPTPWLPPPANRAERRWRARLDKTQATRKRMERRQAEEKRLLRAAKKARRQLRQAA